MSDPLVSFPKGCVWAEFKRRVKRFTIEAKLGGKPVAAHTNNTGSMLGLLRPGMPVYLSPATTPGRKLPYTLELTRVHDILVGVNTLTPNRILRRAWERGLIEDAVGFTGFKAEARIGGSRLDARLDGPKGRLWVECKNVTLVEDDVARFPDAQTERGRKHLRELVDIVKNGDRAALFFLVQRKDGQCFGPADFIDEEYAELFYEALDAGVESWCYMAEITEEGVGLGPRLKTLPPLA